MKFTSTLLLATILLFASGWGWQSAQGADPRPNILLAVADDMSHASAYGFEFLKTPHFDAVAKNGLLFHRMHTPSSKCAPSRAVMLTGRNPWQLEGAANHKPIWPEKFKSVMEALADHGYHTGSTGKGWDPGIHPKNRWLTGKKYNEKTAPSIPTKAITKTDYSSNFIEFLNDKPNDAPFIFWYGCREPHRGYEFKSGVRLGKKMETLDFLPSFWGEAEPIKHDILDYAIEVEYFDHHLGQILAELQKRDELENTLIIITSDNSMPFPRYKGHPHEFATRVPFAVQWPGHITKPGRDCHEFASFVDIAPTLLEAAGISFEDSGMQALTGQSLFDFFKNSVRGRDHVLTGRERNDICRPNNWGYPVRGLLRGDFLYLHNFAPNRWPCGTDASGFRDTDWSPTKSHILTHQREKASFHLCFGKRPPEELYHLSKDPECLNNLAARPDHCVQATQLKTDLFAKLKDQGDPRMLGQGHVFDAFRPEREEEYKELVRRHQQSKKKRR